IPHENDTDQILQITPRALYGRFKRRVEKYGIDMTFHDLRHLNASVMLMLGIPDKYAMERGGWATDNILKSVYQQTFSAERLKVDAKIDDYFNSIVKKN
ncbi:MAG: tyrosine-type recombinase/integrase, partial [Ruminococcus sp.]|nr:tyrosine-type recombinase/integrase [Ruminococcus sp.]